MFMALRAVLSQICLYASECVSATSNVILSCPRSTTTLNYLSRYNMATMVTNNSKLLSTKDKSQKKAELVERLMEMDQEKLEAMLKLMG